MNMSTIQLAGLIWIAGWALTVWVFLRARKRYARRDMLVKHADVNMIIDSLSADPPRSLALMLIFWPVLLVSFTAMLVLAWVEKEPGDR